MTIYHVTVETRPVGAIGVYESKTLKLEIDGNPDQLTIVNVTLDALAWLKLEPRFITRIEPPPHSEVTA